MKNTVILLVEDEKTLANIIYDTFRSKGYDIEVAYEGAEGLKRFYEIHPDILVTDVMMPRIDGFDMVRRIRKNDTHTPVLFLTAKSSPDDVVEGFELGANDYLKKPFAIQELEVRIKALLGKAYITSKSIPEQSDYILGDYNFSPGSQKLTYIPDGSSTDLSHRENEILHFLCRANGEIALTQTLLLEIWGDDDFFNARSLQVFITKMRHHLSKDSRIRIVNVRGTGYRLILP
ncbi:MAG: response regulator transcription factor [Bacteroidales bacterium]|nr:response regulator transcription factor [Bacteroidales bacterium]